MAEVSEGTYSQLRPVEATDGEGDALSLQDRISQLEGSQFGTN